MHSPLPSVSSVFLFPEDISPWAHVSKNLVMQEARIFHQAQINASKCTMVLTKVLYLINTGEHFSNEEGTDLFFAVTKLFQSPDVGETSSHSVQSQPQLFRF
jgi:hypothetical protein